MKVTDRVCNMTIKSAEAAVEIKHEGKTYFFCSTHCRDEFTQAPQRYIHGKAKPQGCCGGDANATAIHRAKR